MIGNIKYKVGNKCYLGTESLENYMHGFLINEEYFNTQFKSDAIRLLMEKFKDEFTEYLIKNGSFAVNLEGFNSILEEIDIYTFFLNLTDNNSRRFITEEQLIKYVSSGSFDITEPYSDIIQIRKLM